jgi:crotonobetainyl-CoA:carnitine CoA-transferase CaiB-like acyl-CoA transferase
MAIAMASLAVIAELLELPELAQYAAPGRPYDDRDVAKPIIEAKLGTDTTEHWLALLATRDIWCAKVQDFDDLMDDPQVAHNELIQTIHHPRAGDIRVIGMPMDFSETPGTIRLAPPLVGEHTDETLKSLGYDQATIDQYHAEEVV